MAGEPGEGRLLHVSGPRIQILNRKFAISVYSSVC